MPITINDINYAFTPGQTILDVARENGVFIPTLCHLPHCQPTGACRICVVEVHGARTLVASCAAPAAEGMIVHTDSDRVIRARRTILRLMLDSGNHDCLLCPASGDCALQSLAFRYGVAAGTFERPRPRYRPETGNPFIVRDFSKCILCGRCVQACNEIQVNEAIDFGYRGAATKIVAGCDTTLAGSDCVFCGECLQVCPVGALSASDARSKPRLCETRPVRTTCPYCGVGCQMDVYVSDGRIRHVLGAEDGHNEGSLCVKGRFALDFTSHPDRLKTPLVRRGGDLVPASWDEALDLVAQGLLSARAAHGPDSLGFLASARCTNEENYLFQKLARRLGTNNVDHCARLCHATSLVALVQSFGSAAPTNPMADVENAEVILVTGSNTTETHPVFGARVKRAVRAGATLVVADPREVGLTRHASLWLRPRPGTDTAWINGLMHVILREGLENRAFIDSRTEGFEALREEPGRLHPGARAVRDRDSRGGPGAGRRPVRPGRGGHHPVLHGHHPARLRHGHGAGPGQPGHALRATWAGPGRASTPCAGRTASRAPATWAACRASSPATNAWTTTRRGAAWKSCGMRLFRGRRG